MRILIGGSPSTGSSVFRQILNRHPNVFCGPETNLFCYPTLYRNWNFARRRILLPGILSIQTADVRMMRGMHLTGDEFGWTPGEIWHMINASRSFPAFCERFFAKPLSKYDKEHWAEKTPANVIQFAQFMRAFDESFIIHTVRDPYNTVSSLIARGMSAYQASSVYLYYTAHGLAARDMPGYIELSYESLVRDPSETLNEEILQPLGLHYTEDMLKEGNPDMAGVTRMPGWRSDELAALSDKSISRFHDEPEEKQVLIATALASIRLTESCLKRERLSHATIETICANLKYTYHDEQERIDPKLLPELRQDRQGIVRGLWWPKVMSSWRKYPVEIV